MPGSLKVVWRNGIAYAVGTYDGKRVRQSLKARDDDKARRECLNLEDRLWKRRQLGEAAVRTFEEAAESYLKQGGDGKFLPRILRYFKGRALSSITPGEIRTMALTLYPRHAPATRNRQGIVPARAVIRHGHSLGWCNSISVELFPVPKSRKHTPVDATWLAAFLARADQDKLPHLAALVLFMNRTAARVSEAIRVIGKDFDLGARKVILGKTKEGEDEVRILPADALMRIAALIRGPNDRVFGYTDPKAPNRRIRAVCKRAGIPYRPTHSAGRHSFGTNTMNLGAKLKDAMDAGGWKTARLFVETYVHSADAGRAVARIFDAETGPVDANLAQPVKLKGYKFGKRRT